MNTMSQPLVSVVTPAYNEEEHLAACIESVLAQTHQNWDYTIVNNRSSDRTLEIAQRYSRRDSRIRVFDNQRHLPMLANHNVAIRQISADAKYCKMVLADDSIFPTCLEEMVAVAEKYRSVGLVSAYEQRGEEVRIKGLPIGQTFVSGREAGRLFLTEKLPLFGSQNSVLYRADLVRTRHPFYKESEMYADFESSLWLLGKSDLGFVHEVLTFSRYRPTSIGAISSDTGVSLKSLLSLLMIYGHEYMTEEELRKSLDHRVAQYYKFLGRRWFVERDRSFWDYHRQSFEEFGIDFSRVRLARTAAQELLGFATNPKATFESIGRFFSLRKIRSSEARSVVSSFKGEPNRTS